MARHKKYKMLLAKAENMDLSILLKYRDQINWLKSPNAYPPNNDYTTGFLCLPEHDEACLYALNGGEIQIKTPDGDWEDTVLESKWSSDGWYMSDRFQSRIK